MIPILKAAACGEYKLYGKIEKIFATYGFVVTADGSRYFFHFGTCITKPEFFKVGDDVEFVLGEDTKTHRLHAQKLYKCTSPPPVCSTLLNRATLFSYIPISLDCASSASLPMSHQSSPPSSSPTSFVTSLSPQMLTKCCLADRENMVESAYPLQKHSSASIRCVGLVLSLPSSSSNIRGYIACEIAGNPTFVRFQLSSLKSQEEKSLIHYGAKVHLTAVWHAQSGTWTAKDIVPEAKEIVPDAQLHFGDQNQNSWEQYGLFTQTRELIPIGNLPTTPNGAYDKAREAWFSVSG